MAARRSRLQIKPNIGGPKAAPRPQTKPSTVPKAQVLKVEDTTEKLASQETVINKTIVSTEKSIEPKVIDEAKEGINVDEQGPTAKSESVIETGKDISNESKAIPEDIGVNTKKPDGIESKSSEAAGPTRPRLRKFGKVNIAAARSKSTSVASEASENPPVVVTHDKSLEESSEVKSNEKEVSQSQVKKEGNAENVTLEVTKPSVTVARRSRFPKAKPNVIDAARRKQNKELDIKDKKSDAGSNVNEKLPIQTPEIKVISPDTKPVTEESVSTKLIPSTSDTVAEEFATEGLTQIMPKPTAVPKPPLKPPIPNIAALSPVKQSAEKRARTVSISEPVVVKKLRRPKIEAPPDQPPDRTSMKMRDIIHWNPSSNPMKLKEKAAKIVPVNVEKENVIDDQKAEPEADDMGGADDDSALPVPQVTIGPDGNIVINEKSLIVKERELDKVPIQDVDIIDETDMITTYSSFRKNTRSKPWSKKDTTKFYKALAMIGIDFFLINQLFPKRTRTEIKKKFQKEEKINRDLIEKVLKEGIKFDASVFEKQEESSDEEPVKKPTKPKKPRKKKDPKGKDTKKKNNGKGKAKKSVNSRILDYFENSSEEDEEDDEPEPKHTEDDPTWQPPGVSHQDGEVVGILMDMSEGRLSTDGNSKVSKSRKGKKPPVSTMKLLQDKINSESNDGWSSATPSRGTGSPGNPDNNNVVPVEISITNDPAVKSTEVQGATNLPQTNFNGPSSLYTDGNIIYPIVNTAVGNQNIQVQSNAVQPPAHQVQTGTEVLQQQAANMLNMGSTGQQTMFGLPQTIDGDQYVLVTVVPEGGGETVIHIYRLHGGLPSQGSNLGVAVPNIQGVNTDDISDAAALNIQNMQGAVAENLHIATPVAAVQVNSGEQNKNWELMAIGERVENSCPPGVEPVCKTSTTDAESVPQTSALGVEPVPQTSTTGAELILQTLENEKNNINESNKTIQCLQNEPYIEQENIQSLETEQTIQNDTEMDIQNCSSQPIRQQSSSTKNDFTSIDNLSKQLEPVESEAEVTLEELNIDKSNESSLLMTDCPLIATPYNPEIPSEEEDVMEVLNNIDETVSDNVPIDDGTQEEVTYLNEDQDKCEMEVDNIIENS